MGIFNKIFSFGKKIVKGIGNAFDNKWVRIIGLTAATVFVTGLSGTGFDGFKTAMQTGGGGLTGFFSAVGSTMSTGFTTIKQGAAGLFGTGAGQQADPSLYKTADGFTKNLPSFGEDLVGKSITKQGQDTAGGVLSSILGSNSGESGSLLRSLIIGGLSYGGGGSGGGGGNNYPGYVKARSNWYGDRSRGSDNPNIPDGLIRRPEQQTAPTDAGAPRARSNAFQPSGSIAAPLQGRATQIAPRATLRPMGQQPLLAG